MAVKHDSMGVVSVTLCRIVHDGYRLHLCHYCRTSDLILIISVDQIFREANIHPNGMVKYEEFVKIVCAPVPDYY